MLEANEKFLSAQSMSLQQQREAIQEEFEPEIDRSGPHITNISEDYLLSGKIVYNFDNVPLVVGRKIGNPKPDIIIANFSVRPRHCIFNKDENENITSEPIEPSCSEFLYVNGQKVYEKVILKHLDRIIIGTNQIYLFKRPGEDSKYKENDIDYEFAIEEKNESQQLELEKEISKLPPRPPSPILINTASIPHEESKKRSVTEPEAHPENHENSAEPPQEHASALEVPPELEPNSKKRQLRSRFAKLFPLVNEANLIATDLSRHVKFNVKIINLLPDEVEKEEDLEPDYWEKELKVEVQNQDYGLIWLWDVEKFEDRLCMLREMLDEQTDPSPEEDPLWDPPEENILGKGYYSLKPLGLLFDNPFNILIISTSGGDAGLLKMNIVPTDEDGSMLDEGPENPEELIGSLINFRVEIHEAWNIPLSHANNVYCEYHFPGLGIRRTNVFPGYSEHPNFNYKEQFTSVLVDDFLCNYMQTKKLAISVFGTGMAMKEETQKIQSQKPTYKSTPAKAPCVDNVMKNTARNMSNLPINEGEVVLKRTAITRSVRSLGSSKVSGKKPKVEKEKEKCFIF
ncbi:unnamed protein product [Blepharisma stoltei]|uniref:FHA domain-containing protein n=1 Tax=Blepharisma stoltei TaxID=1481888 RepID=A0AAU9JVC9_9CILI|nr:unnamed protein product [Blepharisma stoltei]